VGPVQLAEVVGRVCSAMASQLTNHAPAENKERDKLSALASRQPPEVATTSPSRGNSKLAAMSARQPSTDTPAPSSALDPVEDKDANEKLRLEEIKSRLNQRQIFLEKLDRAEKMTCRLLNIAHQTTYALQDLSATPVISTLSKAYRETLQELHPLLITKTDHLIRSYQNHSFETDRSMYATRVEMRLAQERTDLLRMFRDFEKKEREEQSSSSIGDDNNVDITLKKQNTRKRPRDDS
jgi:hypothetical protein